MRSNVIQLSEVRPKTVNKKYKGHDYVLTFIVGENKWKYTITYVTTTVFEGDPKPTMNAAMRAAEKHIDRQLELMG